jgi:hypothetical protein
MKIRLLALIIFVGCVNHDVRDPAKDVAMQVACDRCDKTVSEMFWFQELVDKTDEEETWKGTIYAGILDGSPIILHQPFLASCMACHVYDCEGNRLTLTSQQTEIVVEQMTALNQVYSTMPE